MVFIADDQRPHLPVFHIVVGAVGQGHVDGGHGFDGDVDMVDGVIGLADLQVRVMDLCKVDLGGRALAVAAGDPVGAVIVDVFQDL